MADALRTIYYSKLFLSGNLKGITVHCEMTGSPITLSRIKMHKEGKEVITNAKYRITDVSYQKYTR